MIGVEGQWRLVINGGEIKADELSSFYIEEKLGLGLPVFKMIFNTRDKEKAQKYITPKYKIKIGIGEDSIEEHYSFVCLTHKMKPIAGGDQWYVEVLGVLDAVDYLYEQRFQTYDTVSSKRLSSEVFSTVVSRNGLSPDVLPSKDEMMWIQYGITDRQFLEEVIWHGWFGEHRPVVSCIRRDSKAIYKPYSDVPFYLKIGNTDGVDVKVNEFAIKQNEGFLSTFGAAQTDIWWHDFEEGVTELEDTEVNPLLANIPGVIQHKTIEHEWQGENTHENFLNAYIQNRAFRASLSSNRVTIVVYDYYDLQIGVKYQLLWKQPSGEDSLIGFASDWLGAQVQTLIKENKFWRSLTLTREGLVTHE